MTGVQTCALPICKIKESFYREAVSEYVKRLSRYCTVEITEIAECLYNGEPNEKEITKITETEGKAILSKTEGFVTVLDINGTEMTSENLSRIISEKKQNHSVFTFVIGGSYGLSEEVKRRADLRLSFGRITLPHMLCRVVLCEQLYRTECIARNVSYHK